MFYKLGRLTIGNPCGLRNQFGAFSINPCGLGWREFSCPKSKRWLNQVPEVACGSVHSNMHLLPHFTLNIRY